MSIKPFFCLILSICFIQHVNAQSDTAKALSSQKLLDYKTLIAHAPKIKKGLFTVFESSEHVYFEIPVKLLSKDLLFVNRISRGNIPAVTFPANYYPGDDIAQAVITIEKGHGRRLEFKRTIFTNYADTISGTSTALARSQFPAIIETFPIVSYGTDSSLIVDMTDCILGNLDLFSFGKVMKGQLHLANILSDKSYIQDFQAFPGNIELRTIQSFTRSIPIDEQTSIPDERSFEINTSIILLPEDPMRVRLADPRVGFFTLTQTDYAQKSDGISERSYIKRWRLEPKPEDISKYKQGGLVEPVKPIVFYIDPAMPKQWIPYVIQGVRDWLPCFEQAGFKNAINAVMAPTHQQDSSWSLLDARHSAIVYKPSEFENASGPVITDPRTGEILESHINWYHNVVQLLHDQYLASCAAVDPAARKLNFDDTLMGRLIRYAISHEVGHTLGLTHNMGASSAVPVDSLRNAVYLAANGICPSVMDYSRFNYVAQPADNIPEKDLIARVGVYDRWAIEWGYMPSVQDLDERAEKKALSKWTTGKLSDRRLWYSSEIAKDPRSQTNDIGNDAIVASTYGIANLRAILPKITEWVRQSEGDYKDLNELYRLLQKQYCNYLKHVIAQIGGTYETLKTPDQAGSVYQPVAKEYQKKAMNFITQQQFSQPIWMIDTSILSKTGQTALGIMGSFNDYVIGQMFANPLAMYLIESRNESTFGKSTYTLLEWLEDIRKEVWKEVYTHEPISLYRRNLQERYIKYSVEYLRGDDRALRVFISLPISGFTDLFPTDAIEMQTGQLMEIRKDILTNLPLVRDKASRYHLQFVADQINRLSLHNR